MLRSSSSILFGLILVLSLALVVWWTVFQAGASLELEVAGARLAAGDVGGAVDAFGVASGNDLREVGHSRFLMFVSEGAVFVTVLLISGVLFAASVRRETAVRESQARFLTGATHELKTPLATITLLLESLRDDRLSPDKRSHYLKMGLLEADRLERGLTNVLVAAGLRTAKGRDRRIAGDLADDVRAVVEAVGPRAAAARVTVRSTVPATVPARRDPDAVQLIVHNLVENAIKYSPSGSTVDVALSADDRDAVITVRDRGRGLDATELAHAFEPFWRGSDKATGGSGLGLHLVRQLTEGHGGSVAVDSAGRDAGAAFVVRLPLGGGAL